MTCCHQKLPLKLFRDLLNFPPRSIRLTVCLFGSQPSMFLGFLPGEVLLFSRFTLFSALKYNIYHSEGNHRRFQQRPWSKSLYLSTALLCANSGSLCYPLVNCKSRIYLVKNAIHSTTPKTARFLYSCRCNGFIIDGGWSQVDVACVCFKTRVSSCHRHMPQP